MFFKIAMERFRLLFGKILQFSKMDKISVGLRTLYVVFVSNFNMNQNLPKNRQIFD